MLVNKMFKLNGELQRERITEIFSSLAKDSAPTPDLVSLQVRNVQGMRFAMRRYSEVLNWKPVYNNVRAVGDLVTRQVSLWNSFRPAQVCVMEGYRLVKTTMWPNDARILVS